MPGGWIPQLRRWGLVLASTALGLVAGLRPQPTPRAAIQPAGHPFQPSTHGFHFLNRFEGSPLPISLGALEQRLNLPSRYGLCGGMSSAAADFFVAGRSMPVLKESPARGTPLYRYLYQRQIDSLGTLGLYAAKFASWMAMPDSGLTGTQSRTKDELDSLIARLGRGELVLLGLVLVSFDHTSELWQNHQVMAYKLEPRPKGAVDILIYDPNFPNADHAAIRVEPCVVSVTPPGALPLPMPVLGVACKRVVPGRTNTPVRGFFPMPYAPATPPAGL
jgi:hypothetical protein